MRIVARVSRAIAIGITTVMCCVVQATTTEEPWGCLRAVSGSDNKNIVPCAPGDPLAISRSAQVSAAMAYLGIRPDMVRFNGCEKTHFATGMDPLHDGGYLVTYPANEKRFLAPITHELAHVVQMQLTHPMQQLSTEDSLKVELGADFVAGIVFSAQFPQLDRSEFQNNVQLAGLYNERGVRDPHGPPSQRVAAFRYGLNFRFREDVPDVRAATLYFKDVLYADISKM